MNKDRWICLFAWLFIIIVGTIVSNLWIPPDGDYLTGFITGTFSFMCLRLFADCKEDKKNDFE